MVALLAVLALALLAAYLLGGAGSGTEQASGGQPATARSTTTSTMTSTTTSHLPWVAESALPAQARQTLALIRAGGPYPYPRNDDQTFGNREGRLPQRASGYYREYTVPTPGSPDRGARRIIVGRDGDMYFTDDHYESFRRIQEGR